jgi:hypothetical protein
MYPEDGVLGNVVTSRSGLSPPTPRRILLDKFGDSDTLAPGDSLEIPITIHVSEVGAHELQLLLVHRQVHIHL